MTRFKLALLLGFALGWAVGSGRAQELWRQVRHSADDRLATSPTLASGSGSRTAESARVASA
jgi:hypothetical protein